MELQSQEVSMLVQNADSVMKSHPLIKNMTPSQVLSSVSEKSGRVHHLENTANTRKASRPFGWLEARSVLLCRQQAVHLMNFLESDPCPFVATIRD